VKALEGAEEMLRGLSVEAGAVVTREESALAADVSGADLDARRLVPVRELPGVVDEIGEDAAQAGHVGGGVQVRRDHGLDLAPGLRDAQLLDDRGSEGADVDLCDLQVSARGERERHQMVDEHGHALRRGAHALQMRRVGLVEALGGIIGDHPAEAVDGSQGGAGRAPPSRRAHRAPCSSPPAGRFARARAARARR
jgi:hypothetical protein